ncbi:MAG: SagB/ThcOx family dehydrogenase [Jatrophihabitantaceae bacterium]
MSTAPPPTVFAALRSFAYDPRGPWSPAGDQPVDLAEEFHEASKISAAFPGRALGPAGRELATSNEAPFALGRKAIAHTGPSTALAPPGPLELDLRELTYRRRSRLPANCGTVGIDDLGHILGLSAGSSRDRPGLRVVPSGGAMYPLDVIVIAHAVDELAAGAHVYDPIGHALLARGEVDPVRFHASASASVATPQPALTLAVVATFARSRAKYGLRGYRFALLEAGHLIQAAVTVATALGLATLPWGGFVDAAVDAELELDGLERSCVYLLAISAPDDGEPG